MTLPDRTLSRNARALRARRRSQAVAKTLKTARSRSRSSRLLLSLSPQLSKPQTANTERRTVFFNFSHPQGLFQDESDRPRRYFFNVGGRSYRLTPVSENPGVLARAREGNAFLGAVPEDQITHYLEGAVFSTDITPLAYVGSVLDHQAGTWSMDAFVQILSPSVAPQAYSHARLLTPDGPLPLSSKRDFYGIVAASSEQDVADEFALIDYTDAARTLIALQPDMLCANPAGAEEIAVSYISANSSTTFLARILQNQGPANPQETPDQPNGQGWATLIPLNQDDGTPFKMEDGLNQYFPDWSASVDARVGSSINALLPQVKNDRGLGSNITNLSPDSDAVLTDAIEQELTGKVWYRRDGVTAVDHGSPAHRNSEAPKWEFRQRNGETGLAVTQPGIGTSPEGNPQITFNNVANWFLRFLGVYVQFVDRYGKVVPASSLPSDTVPDRNASLGLDRGNALFAGIVPPVFSIAGIPIYPPGSFSFLVNMPSDASTVNVFYAGLGFSGSAIGPDRVSDVGMGLTLAANLGLPAIFMAVGVSTLAVTIKAFIPDAQVIAAQIINVVGFTLGSGVTLVTAGVNLMRGLLNGLAGRGLAKLATVILTQMTAAQLISAVPVAGQIARAAAAAVGVLQLAVTLVEVGLSPPAYQFDLTFTQDRTVIIQHDPERGSFPHLPAGYILYYKLNYLFDNGSPHYLDHVDVPDPYVPSISVELKGIPWGGQVNVSVGFYARKESTNPSENDWCASRGTTGLVSNTVDDTLTIVLSDILVPLQPETVYVHTSKITLDATGHHRWTKGVIAPPYVPPSSGQQPGNIAAFRSITVRQAKGNYPGYVGYSWQSYSSGVLSCQTGARGQLDQAANLNTNQGNGGANAQIGYTATACGLQGGASSGLKLSYNPLIDPTANFYLDTSSLMLREVQLDPVPDFSDPLAGKSFGKLNLDSTVLLLHPAGHAVSINNANSKLEALHLPPSALDDTVAAKRFLARTYSGQGSRPGLMKSPIAACITAEGAILVLEDSTANNRIQAFDLGGNPVPYFQGQNDHYFLYLSATEGSTYLDLAVEFTGYLYVLSRSGSPPVFRLDIYHEAQSGTQPICTTRGMNAARLTVDFWRNVYTLNYEVLKLPSGQIPSRTEPSLSFWVPPPPEVLGVA